MMYPVDRPARRALILWLAILCLLVFAMVVVGGATRLTESGLSIVYWEPVRGALPPLTVADWAREFARYQQSPQYQQINSGMTLDQFKTIFWWEWAHRQLGRFIGLAFVLPFLWLSWRHGPALRRWRPRLLLLLMLGGAQGAIGWWMVASGLVHEPAVSPLRLMTHLGLALFIFALLLWTLLDVRQATSRPLSPRRSGALVLAGLLTLMILLGALVAGNDAGFASDSWPLMDGRLIPRGMMNEAPWWRNDLLLHWLHRSLALLLLGHALAMAWRLWRDGRHPLSAALAATVGLQFLLGVMTILHHVPVLLGTLHQANAVLLIAVTVIWLHQDSRSA
jgi:heme a synthase